MVVKRGAVVVVVVVVVVVCGCGGWLGGTEPFPGGAGEVDVFR